MCARVHTNTRNFLLSHRCIPPNPSLFNTVVKFFLKNLQEHKKSMQEIRFNSFHTVICLTASRQNTAASSKTWQGLRGLCPAANPPTLPWLLLLAWLCYTKKLCWSFGHVWLNMIQHTMHSVYISFVSLKCGWIAFQKKAYKLYSKSGATLLYKSLNHPSFLCSLLFKVPLNDISSFFLKSFSCFSFDICCFLLIFNPDFVPDQVQANDLHC